MYMKWGRRCVLNGALVAVVELLEVLLVGLRVALLGRQIHTSTLLAKVVELHLELHQ